MRTPKGDAAQGIAYLLKPFLNGSSGNTDGLRDFCLLIPLHSHYRSDFFRVKFRTLYDHTHLLLDTL